MARNYPGGNTMTFPAGEWVQFGVGGPTLSKSGTMIASSAPITVFGIPVATGATATGGQLSLWSGTKAQYDLIPVKSQACIYVVTAAATLEGMVDGVTSGVDTGQISSEETALESAQNTLDAVQTGDIAVDPAVKTAVTKSTRKK
jgi:hypothetical protein